MYLEKKFTKNRRKFDYFWISFGHWRTRDFRDISLILGKLWRVTNELIVLVQYIAFWEHEKGLNRLKELKGSSRYIII